MPAAPGDQQVPQQQEVFISYSRKDKEFVRRLYKALKRHDREAWVDWHDIRPAEEFMQAIYGAIEGANTFVFVLTLDSLASVPCRLEIARAAAHNKRTDPDAARRARGEADFPTSRALKLAPDSDEVKKLRDEVVKLLVLNTN